MWISESAVNIYDNFVLERPKNGRENLHKSARKQTPLPVNFFKKCPWTQKSARDTFEKHDVHGHFRGSRKKNTDLGDLGDLLSY